MSRLPTRRMTGDREFVLSWQEHFSKKHIFTKVFENTHYNPSVWVLDIFE
jgi:hypothetical protein